MRIGGQDLAAIDLPAAIHFRCSRLERGKVGSRAGFAHPDAEDAFAGSDPWQEILFLRVGAEFEKNRSALPVGDPMRTDGHRGGQKFLIDDIAFNRAEVLPAIPVGLGQPDPATLYDLCRHLLAKAKAHLLGWRQCARCALFRCELTHFAAQVFPGGREGRQVKVQPRRGYRSGRHVGAAIHRQQIALGVKCRLSGMHQQRTRRGVAPE